MEGGQNYSNKIQISKILNYNNNPPYNLKFYMRAFYRAMGIGVLQTWNLNLALISLV